MKNYITLKLHLYYIYYTYYIYKPNFYSFIIKKSLYYNYMNITYTLHVLHWLTNFIVLLKNVLHTNYIYITAITYITFNHYIIIT